MCIFRNGKIPKKSEKSKAMINKHKVYTVCWVYTVYCVINSMNIANSINRINCFNG
jgi:hypothetical protein